MAIASPPAPSKSETLPISSLSGAADRSSMTVSLGPGNSVQYNPRCLVRELSQWWSAKTKVDATYPLVAQSNNVGEFQDRLQRGDGVHAGGHFSIGGNPGGVSIICTFRKQSANDLRTFIPPLAILIFTFTTPWSIVYGGFGKCRTWSHVFSRSRAIINKHAEMARPQTR
jgi:hypothetical protein